MFVKLSLCDRLVCFAELVEMTLLALFSLLPVPNGFLTVCLAAFFAAILILFPPLTTSANSGAASQHPRVLQLRRCMYAMKELLFFQKLVQVNRIPVHVFDHYLYRMKPLHVSKQPSCNVSFRIESNVGRVSKHQNKLSDTDRYNGIFSTLVSLRSI